MTDSETWRVVLLTSIFELAVIITVAGLLIFFYPAYAIYVIIGAICVIIIYFWLKYRIYEPIVTKKTIEFQDEIIGKRGKAITDLKPRGQVKIRNEVWSARSASGFITSNTKIEVVQVDGIQLVVKTLKELNGR
jgi:membrane protein implicated in regulation of membrane protease activity